MKVLFISVFIFISSIASANQTAFDIEESKNRCQTSYKDSPIIYSSDLQWGMTPEFMEQKFQEIYESGKRLDLHGFYNAEEKQFYLYKEMGTEVTPVKITEEFIKSVTLQIETALENGFAEQVFFSDMGHSHLYFPDEHWDQNYISYPTPITPLSQAQQYEDMLADPKMRPLYHLCEQLKMTDENKVLLEDPAIQFRYWNRNFVGQNDGSKDFEIVINHEGNYNTVSSIIDHHSYSAGFQVSASKNGCFPYKDKDGSTKYFDIGLKDLYQDPSLPMDDWGGF